MAATLYVSMQISMDEALDLDDLLYRGSDTRMCASTLHTEEMDGSSSEVTDQEGEEEEEEEEEDKLEQEEKEEEDSGEEVETQHVDGAGVLVL